MLFAFFFAQAVEAQPCPDIAGFTKLGEFQGHSYYLSNSNLNWKTANNLTQLKGGYLATMNGQDENDFLKNHIGNNMVFIGLSDENQEGNPTWANGETVTFDLSSGNSVDGDFAVMNFWNGHWAFGNKWEERPFVMEVNCDGASVDPTTGAPIQVFIFAGQSNMTGGGVVNELNPALQALPANVRFSNLVNWAVFTDFRTSGNFGPDLGFVHRITQDNPNQKYLIIKYGQGGSGMRDWLPGVWHYNILMNHINSTLGNLDEDYELAGLMWMQGETDAYSPQESGLYETRLTSFINSLRNQLGEPNLPVVIGQVDPPGGCCTVTVNEAQSNFVSNDGYASYVFTGGVARRWYDQIHYNTVGQLDLGQRFYTGYQSITSKGFEMQCPEDVVKDLSWDQDVLSVSWNLESVYSDCDLSDVVNFTQVEGLPSGADFAAGSYLIAYSAQDDCGYIDSCQFSIAINSFSSCPSEISGYEKLGEFGHKAYFLSENMLTWEDANVATGNNGYLATIETQLENNFIRDHLNGNMVFIGYNDAENENTGAWPLGGAVDFDLSYENSDVNDYAVMNFWFGTWQMVNKWVQKRYVLQVDCAVASVDFRESTPTFSLSDISPNPAISTIMLPVESDFKQDYLFEIFNETGQRFLSEKRYLPEGASTQYFDISTLPNGIYYVKSAATTVQKFIKAPK